MRKGLGVEQRASHGALHMVRALVVALTAVAFACSIVGCKTTDFFTEVLISPDATTVDEDNPDKTIINSPDAEEESSALSALQWTDESSTTEDTQNLVTWSEDPNSTMSTRHSYYDPKPLFPGIESSDGVRLVFNAKADLDHEVDNANGDGNDDMQSVSSGNSGKQTTVQSVQQGDSNATVADGGGDGAGTAAGGTEQAEQQGEGESEDASGDSQGDGANGGDGSGEDEGEGDSPDNSEEKGDTTDKHGGFGGSLTVYDPNNAKAEIPQADSIAVIGKRVAVLVQAIGGEGAICAMSSDAYNNTDAGTSKSFKSVFGSECSSNVVTWESDDSSIKEVKVSKLTKNLKGKTLILYDQELVDGDDDPNKTFFTEKQLEALDEAGVIGFAPMSFDTEYGIVDAAYYVGKALAKSSNLASGWSSKDMADAYVKAVNSIVKAVVSINGTGNWVYGDEASNKKTTEYKGSDVGKDGTGTETYVHGIVATDAQTGLSYSGDGGEVDAGGIVLFAGYGQNKYSPLGFWMQAAGVADALWNQNETGSSNDGATSPKFLTLLWGTNSSGTITKKKLKGSGGAYTNWHGVVSDMFAGTMTNTNGGSAEGGGLGSKNMPYLIVSGSQSDKSLTGAKVKKAVVKSINSASNYTPYSAFEYSEEVAAALAPYNSNVRSSIGDTNSRKEKNPFKNGLDANDVVRVNPTGLLGSWTRGNFESVLEAAWLACVYSKTPAGCDYQPNYDWDSFSAKIGDDEVKGKDHDGDAAATLRDLVQKFYSKFYRCDVDYSSVVTDEGLSE